MSTRIYIVKDKTGTTKLVEASTPSQAVRHVSKAQFEVSLASTKDVVTLMKNGVTVESAAEPEVNV